MGFLEILLLVGWFALLMLSIMAYFFFRRKFAYTKAIVEFVFIAAVLIFSVAVKAVVWGVNAGGTLTLSKFFEALYTGIGGLTFEGLPDAATGVGKEVSEISLILFYGAPLYAGIMTLFILSARASYEFYSKIRLKFVLNKNIYIITDLSEETIKLAESIRKGDKKSLIVFAGPRIAVFDRKNELCRRVMSNGMLYWSYAKKKKIKDGGIVSVKSIAASLSGCFGFGNKGGVYRNVGNYKKRIRVFAFASENHIPLESENIDTVYDDVCTRIEHKDSLRIEYYILIRDKIDYPAYQKMVDGLKEKFVKNSGMEKDKFNDFFNIKCWCEADMIGLQSFEALIENNFLEELKDNKPLYMWSIGFGSRGEAIAREIYIKTASAEYGKECTDKDGKKTSIKFIPRKFFAEVFDKEAKRIGGIFRANHPNYLLVTKNEENVINKICKVKKDELKKLFGKGIKSEDIDTACRHIKSVGALFAEPKKIFVGKYDESLPKPIYRFRQTDCREFKFFDIIDKKTGKDCAGLASGAAPVVKKILKLSCDFKERNTEATEVETSWEKYFNGVYYPKVIVVATGDDDLNIQIANTVIQDVLQESNTVSQYLLVHIADKNNNHRVIKPDNSYLKVLTVGNFNDIYQYKYISDDDPSRYHFTYKKIDDNIKEGFNAIGVSAEYINGKVTKEENAKNAIRCFYALTEHSLGALQETLRTLKEKKLYKNVINDFQKSIDQLQQSSFYSPNDWNDEILKIAKKFVESMLEEKKGSSEKNTDKRKINMNQCYNEFNKISLWQQYSNLQVCTFASVLGFLAKQTIGKPEKDYDFRLLSAIEHDRWMRLHMAFGWIYGETKDEMKKIHPCLGSYSNFNEANRKTVFYDLMNVVWAIIDSKEKSAHK